MILHGLALTDPIRQFNDYGYTMCSTISGINCSIWDATFSGSANKTNLGRNRIESTQRLYSWAMKNHWHTN